MNNRRSFRDRTNQMLNWQKTYGRIRYVAIRCRVCNARITDENRRLGFDEACDGCLWGIEALLQQSVGTLVTSIGLWEMLPLA
jgi:hypothetical protein